ncbi:GNAT family N-acetyltransferase [Limnochorda pilosa]|uniref:N-acetyltransferase domain-containing protein n=1 Tax=Limnochorda pilosa TaxID=1555112 RepID=A0A0K2SHK1_LIMPI|nr:GNAT family N-acetyltransferase [Limnochorda pilosa]BAS26570.1 hypothetical protein LIP_0713 [Limnochorda pilosa]
MEALVRRLTRADIAPYAALDAFAFQGDEKAQRREWTASPPVGLGAFEPGGGGLLAALRIWPFLAFFQGRPVPTGGVASVASWPEVRRHGLVARLLRESLNVMREEGQVVSALYPFSYSFYRRYGWELAFTRNVYEIPLVELDRYRRPPGGRFQPAGPDDLPAMDALYRRFVSRWNGPLLRETLWWRERILHRQGPAGAGPRRTILWEDRPRVRAYVVYGFQNPPAASPLEAAPGRVLHVYDWAVEDGEAMHALLSFLVQHDSMAGRMSLAAPSDWDLLPLLVNPRVQVRRAAGAMLRIVDMDRFLGHLFPAGEEDQGEAPGQATPPVPAVHLEVSDELAPWNVGTWLVPLAGGAIERLPAGAANGRAEGSAPVLRGSIQVWSQVLSGYLPALQAWHLGLLELEEPGTEAGRGQAASPGVPDPEDPMGTDRPMRRRERLLQAFDARLGLRTTYLPDGF